MRNREVVDMLIMEVMDRMREVMRMKVKEVTWMICMMRGSVREMIRKNGGL